MFTTKDGQVYQCVEATMDVAPDGAGYSTCLTIEWLPQGSEEWQTAYITDQRMAAWDDNGPTDKVRSLVGMYLDLTPDCIAEIDVVYV